MPWAADSAGGAALKTSPDEVTARFRATAANPCDQLAVASVETVVVTVPVGLVHSKTTGPTVREFFKSRFQCGHLALLDIRLVEAVKAAGSEELSLALDALLDGPTRT